MIWISLYLLGIAFSVTSFLCDLIIYSEEYDWSDERIKEEIEDSIPLITFVSLTPVLNYVNGIHHSISVIQLKKGDEINNIKSNISELIVNKIIKLIKKRRQQ